MKWLVWIVAALLLLVWSVGAAVLGFAVDALAAWMAGGAGVDGADWVSGWSVPTWMLLWLDAHWLQHAQLMLVELLDALRGASPGLGRAAGWLLAVVWAVWAFGALVLLGIAALMHRLVGRSASSAPGSPVSTGAVAP